MLGDYIPPTSSPDSGETLKVCCPSCLRGLKMKPEMMGKRGKCPKCGCMLAFAGTPAAGTESPGVADSPPTQERWFLPAILFSLLALLLGMVAVPVGVWFSFNFLGASLAVAGFLLGLSSLLAALIHRQRVTLPAMSAVVCASALLGVVLLAKGPSGWFGTPEDQQANATGAEEEEIASQPSQQGRTSDEAKPTKSKRRVPRVEEEESPGVRIPRPARTEIGQAMQQLKSEKAAERIAAAGRLKKIGEKARPATRALCEAALDSSEEVRLAALEALEKIDPALHKHVIVLLVDGNAFHQQQAALALGQMGSAAQPALPILLAHARRNAGLSGNEVFNNYLVTHDLHAVGQIKADDPAVIKTLIELATYTPQYGYAQPFRSQAVNALGKIGSAHASRRKELVPILVRALDHDGTTCLNALRALGDFGPDAKEAIPALKKLKLNPNMQIRQAAATALERIEKE